MLEFRGAKVTENLRFMFKGQRSASLDLDYQNFFNQQVREVFAE